MRVEKQFTVEVPLDRVWRFITAPEEVAACIPGCEAVQTTGDSKYRATIRVQVGPIKTTFNVDVETTEERPPGYFAYTTTGEEGGRASRLRAESTLTLKPVNEHRTEVQYTSDIQVVGRLGKFGLGMMKKKADSLGDEFVANLRQRLEGGAGVPAPAPAAAGASRRMMYAWAVAAAAAAVAIAWYFLT